MTEIQNSLPFHIFLPTSGKQRCNKGSTEQYCLFIAANIIVDAFGLIRHIVL